jgi:hypothetical protein
MREAHAAIERTLGSDPRDVVPRATGVGADLLRDWDLPHEAKEWLQELGLPPARADGLMRVVGDVRAEDDLHTDDGRALYRLAVFGQATIAARSGDGQVVAVRSETAVHPQLAAAGGLPRHEPVNSSVPAFVECSWRWDAIAPNLAVMLKEAGADEVKAWTAGTLGNDVDPYAEYHEACRQVLRRFEEIDPVVVQDDSFWSGVVVDVW